MSAPRISPPRRIALTVLLGLEISIVAVLLVFLAAPWEETFSEFENRPITTTQAYVNSAPLLIVLTGLIATLASLWFRGGRLAGLLVPCVALGHVAITIWFVAPLYDASAFDLIAGAGLYLGYAALLLAVLGRPPRSAVAARTSRAG